MDKSDPTLTVARTLSSDEGKRARKITALKCAYLDGALKIDETELARRLLETAIRDRGENFISPLTDGEG